MNEQYTNFAALAALCGVVLSLITGNTPAAVWAFVTFMYACAYRGSKLMQCPSAQENKDGGENGSD